MQRVEASPTEDDAVCCSFGSQILHKLQRHCHQNSWMRSGVLSVPPLTMSLQDADNSHSGQMCRTIFEWDKATDVQPDGDPPQPERQVDSADSSTPVSFRRTTFLIMFISLQVNRLRRKRVTRQSEQPEQLENTSSPVQSHARMFRGWPFRRGR